MKRIVFGLALALSLLQASLVLSNAQALVPVTVDTKPSGLLIVVDGTNCTAPASFAWTAGSTHGLNTVSPQNSGDGHVRYVFAYWNDGGSQTHSITVPASSTNYIARFSPQYRLDITLFPTNAGTVAPAPASTWYAVNQVVQLNATTNAGYRVSYWQGVNSQSTNTAQVVMAGYRSIVVGFVPYDYPSINITNTGAAAPGNLIGSIVGQQSQGTRTYNIVLDNSGLNIIYASATNTIYRFVTPQGLDAVADSAAFTIKDENFQPVASYTTSGYPLDIHDVKLLPNGHVLVFGTLNRAMDVSQFLTNGTTTAMVTDNVVQELDANKHVVFEWHTLDHIPLSDSFFDASQSTIDYSHMNATALDPTDYNLLVSLRTTSEIVKVNRQTGQVMWRLGGRGNQFTFVGEHAENAPYYTVGQHDVHRLANGNLIFFDNGNIYGGGITPSDRTYSRAVEYKLDEVNKVATLVWEFRHTPDILSPCTGAVKRFANGNTLIDWGCGVPASGTIMTEVSPDGHVVFEMTYQNTNYIPSAGLGRGVTKQVWNSQDLVKAATFQGLVAGQTYVSAGTGASLTVNGLSGATNNSIAIERHLDAVRFPEFPGVAPQVTMEHVLLSSSNIDSMSTELVLGLPDNTHVFDAPLIKDPAQVTIYWRPTAGQGVFTPLATTYDAASETVKIPVTQSGEFIFTCPDLAQVPLAPLVINPIDGDAVNQNQSLNLQWAPEGFAETYDLQVGTNSDFSTPIVDVKGLFTSQFTFTNMAPATRFYWRVKTYNEGGSSDWTTASFITVPSTIRVIAPNGGEQLRRTQKYTILWTNTVSESVAIDLYKGSSIIRTLAITTNSGAYVWQTGVAGGPGTNYWVRIRSLDDPGMFDDSDHYFSMDVPVIDAGSLVRDADGRVQFDLAAGAGLLANVTVWGATTLAPANWIPLGAAALANGTGVFIDSSAATNKIRFYRLTTP